MCKSMYIDLLKKSLLDVVYEEETEVITNGECWPKRALTMIGRRRLENVQYCIESVLEDGIEGDFIETGVWRGGSVIFMKGMLKVYGDNIRKVFVADSFKGVPPPDADNYPIDISSKLHLQNVLKISVDEVKSNFNKFSLLDHNVVFLEGWFKDTLNIAPIKKLAVLRLDGDLYESTWEALSALYYKLQPGGYVIIDDYRWVNCEKAVTEFRNKNNIKDTIIPIDSWGVYWRKS